MAFFPLLAISVILFDSWSYAATQQFSIELAWATRAPDGFERPQILVNGQSPGPALVIDQYDEVEFLVCNKLNESTPVHFHGIEQLNTPWSDGVPGLSQKPIPPQGEFLYKWTATEYGTYWYHGHYRSQLNDGLFGPIYVRPCATQAMPFSKISSDPGVLASLARAEENPQLVTISDWSHVTSAEYLQIENATNADVYCTNSILINGKGRVDCLTEAQQHQALAPPFQALFDGPLQGTWMSENGCSPFTPVTQANYTANLSALPEIITGCQATNSPLQEFDVDPRDGWVSFNFISATAIQAPVLSIDEHPMWVYAVDGRYVVPQKVDGLQIFNGERYSVMVQLNKRPGSYTIRASNFGLNQLISGFATMKYTRGGGGRGWHNGGWGRNGQNRNPWKQTPSTPSFTYGGFPISPNITLLNETLLLPFENAPPSRRVDQTHILRLARAGAPWKWTLDGTTSYPMQPVEFAENAPLLYNPTSIDAQTPNLVIRTQNNTWIDLIIVSTEPLGPPHPMHKHSNKAYVIGSGVGVWNHTTVEEAALAQPQAFNFETPLLRDGYITPAAAGAPTWLAIRYHVVNPGAFMLHCHIQPHLAGGMAVAFLDGVDAWPVVPGEYGKNGGGGNGIGR
ncbi:multicopper oxidase [Zasmidium cellare ATCC 36951]|uniref:Multicopper oxidase n=1 Tax=Zasmidium cellare ATCC 36951 TaxID=1080233 RepID=A0A6A6C8J0_ZASCE|nr:multicopper oxidase [Zasmidium cellare ATCC 36951]KAF2161746.1 multicopper oxidase [Zasmidium cellare ATCC 36951]